MTSPIPDALALIAGKGVYPCLLAESARKQGVARISAIAFRKETSTAIEEYADTVVWLRLGQLAKLLDALKASGARHAVMAGQITPTSLFTIRMDSRMLSLLKRLKARNAETIFGAVGDELKELGIELMPASMFMEAHMPAAGVLTTRGPTVQEQADIDLGIKVAGATSALDIGQTVVIKQGTVLAVEAFEGTDETIERAGRLGGAGSVIVKIPKQGHDMRFDIPVLGLHTIKLLRKARAAVMAVEAGRTIMLEREKIIDAANKMGLCLTAMANGQRPALDRNK